MFKLNSVININIRRLSLGSLARNPNGIQLIEKNLDKINWDELSSNPNAIDILINNLDKVDLNDLLGNLSIFELDYESLKDRIWKYGNMDLEKN